jgi:hypothetical protein
MRARTRTGTADDIALEVELAKGSHTRKLVEAGAAMAGAAQPSVAEGSSWMVGLPVIASYG